MLTEIDDEIGRLKDQLTRLRKVKKISHGPEYAVWAQMKQRCLNPNHEHYADYGGRGIGVDERWLDFGNFIEDMGRRPSNLHTLERQDNDAGYSRDNCRWATRTEQANNRRNTIKLAWRGRELSLSQWCVELGMRRDVIYQRVMAGWSIEAVFTTPINQRPCGQVGDELHPSEVVSVERSDTVAGRSLAHKWDEDEEVFVLPEFLENFAPWPGIQKIAMRGDWWTATKLLEALKSEAVATVESFLGDRSWPKTAIQLGMAINKYRVEMRREGVVIKRKGGRSGGRMFKLYLLSEPPQ